MGLGRASPLSHPVTHLQTPVLKTKPPFTSPAGLPTLFGPESCKESEKTV